MRKSTALPVLVSGALAAAVLGVVTIPSDAAGLSPSPRGAAVDRLRSDAGRTPVLARDDAGRVSFVAARDSEIRNPSVTPSTSVSKAARAHLDRYGAALGLSRTTTLVRQRTTHTLAGTDVVSYQQRVSGVPVIGGDVVVTLAPDRQLTSLLSTASEGTDVSAAEVGVARAGQIALRDHAGLSATDRGRWVFDPSVLHVSAPYAARTVRRVEVGNGADVRRTVLVDDRTGAVLLDVDDIQTLDRVVCDNQNVRSAAVPCTSGFARTEGPTASPVAEVESAFQLSGAVATYYQQVAGIDLTQKLGIDVGGTRKLASTVRFCPPTGQGGCPYMNASWSGSQMFFGQGFAGADDVVGHEMTHGVIDQYSHLFYFGQSGAINESIADVMGEIVDHRNPSAGDSATNWDSGEDLPFPVFRNLQDPTLHDQPDSTASAFWDRDDVNYGDNGGVHTNSGVGNKTAYLISQGGTFGGQTMAGIDGTDTDLTRSGKLWFQAIQSLSSGSDYADLARVLDQSCQSLVKKSGSGFTATTCANVHKAGLATQLTTEPAAAPHPADAAATCPSGTTKRELFNSETGTPSTKFVTGSTWGRASTSDPDSLGDGLNAHSGTAAWHSSDPDVVITSSLVMRTGVALPSARKSYLHFQQWRHLESDVQGADPGTRTYYDGGTVEAASNGGAPISLAPLPWVNGPVQQQAVTGLTVFGGDSFGYVASRVDLSSLAGRSVKPQFTMRTDAGTGDRGWWLDDISVYTCDLRLKVGSVGLTGTPKVGKKLTAKPAGWTAGTTFTYQWLRAGKVVPGKKGKTYALTAKDVGKKISVRVTGRKSAYTSGTRTSAARGPVKKK